MAVFTWIPDFGLSKKSAPEIREAKFGDGYSQRIRMGLNSDPKTFPLEFKNRSNIERDEIEAFLEARGGVEPFDWTPPWGSAGRFVCKEWNVTYSNFNNNQIAATFLQVFDPLSASSASDSNDVGLGYYLSVFQ